MRLYFKLRVWQRPDILDQKVYIHFVRMQKIEVIKEENMRFELYLNQISASHALNNKKKGKIDLDCFGMCNPYNKNSLIKDDCPKESLRDFYSAMKKWRFKKEDFGHLIFDPGNSRIYDVDDEAEEHLRRLCEAETFENFVVLAESSATYDVLMREVQAVCI